MMADLKMNHITQAQYIQCIQEGIEVRSVTFRDHTENLVLIEQSVAV